ncbi:hypothetical protein BWI90_20460 [Escherichia coli]|nr:hypothetical protein BWI90_20460 [Escherichia coli]
MMMNQGCTITIIGNINRSRGGITLRLRLGWKWICPYISRHLLSLNPLQARCRRYSRGER